MQSRLTLPPETLPVPPFKPVLTSAVLAYRLRCLSDDLTRLAHAVPEADVETSSQLLRARDAVWFAARRLSVCGHAQTGVEAAQRS